MHHKKQQQVKTVHRFTQSAQMKFRPIVSTQPISPQPQPSQAGGVFNKVTSILGKLFSNITPRSSTKPLTNKTFTKATTQQQNQTNDKSSNSLRSSRVSQRSNQTTTQQPQKCQQKQVSILFHPKNDDNFGRQNIVYLQKITIDTFLIGNYHQIDCITISVIDNQIDTEINWSLNLRGKIVKLAIQPRKGHMVMECEGEILVYQYDLKKLKKMPSFKAKTKLLSSPKFIIFLKEYLLGVFYANLGAVYQIDEQNNFKAIFTKKYGINESLQLFQIPKPIESTLNIFFTQKTAKGYTYILWRLQLQFKAISSTHDYKSIVRIYQLPGRMLRMLKIDNYSKSTIILNFKYQILAAKDGFIIDTTNTNLQQQDSYLLYQGDKLLHISNNKVFIYSFKINLIAKSKKIQINSLDSILIKRDAKYNFLNCLEMLNGNFVIFYQIKQEYNKKMKGEIDYTIAVTQKLSVKQKLNEIFDFKNPNELKIMAEKNYVMLHEKCDVAFKIGLNRKQVYLELWNKSNKNEVQDYKFLLSTMDYDTIKKQIENKLKKASMSFSQVYKLEQGCFEMLRNDLFSGTQCTEETVKNFLISHLLLRKLVFYKNISLSYKTNMKDVTTRNSKGQEQVNKVIYIDIQQYTHICKMDLKTYFLQKVHLILSGELNEQKNLRIFLREFKFQLRIIYTQLLEQLIIHSKTKLVNFLKIVPQILPNHSSLDNLEESVLHTQITLKQSIWGDIKSEQWKDNLHIQQITTIHNRQLIEQIVKTMWFKRNLYTHHDLITYSKQKIMEIQKSNQSESTFYLLIEKIFQHQPKTQKCQELITFIQAYYTKLPQHLKGKIFLYKNLYDYFKKEKYSSSNIETFNKFLKMKDHELFKQLFRYQKIKKGCLLKDVKYIYEDIRDGIQLYYDGLLHYFQSDLSEISDLKYILNRLNSQKQQFHIQNEGIYNMLVQALMLKLKLGSQNDIPIEQVMIYIENIPLSKDNALLQDLKVIQMINQEADRFKRMKINMSLKQIIDNCEDIVTALVNYEIKEKRVLEITDQQQFKNVSYNILAEIQTVKDKIYKGKYKDLAYFLYLSKIMQQESYIKYGDLLLKDQYLLQYYNVDQKIIQNLVLYMYKWKFNQEPTFIKNQSYLRQLLTLLSTESQCRGYIQSQIQLALSLSTPNHPIEYPLAKGTSTISLEQIQQIFNNYSIENIKGIDIVRIYHLVRSMQELCAEDEIIKLQQIYEVILMRLIKLNDLKGSIPYIKTLIELTSNESKGQNYTIIFCYIILQIILIEVPDSHRKKMIQIIYHLHHEPLKLIEFIQKRINLRISNSQEQIFIYEQYQKIKSLKIYTKDNMLWDEQILKKLGQKQEKYSYKFQDLLNQTRMHININRDQFRLNVEYSFYFLLLVNNPYALVKYITLKREMVNLKLLRSYLSYVFREDVFNGFNVLYLGRRLFIIILEHCTSQIPIETLIAEYKELSFEEDIIEINENEMQEFFKNNLFAGKIKKSIDVFNKKIKQLKKMQGKDKDKQADVRKKKTNRIEGLLSSALSIKSNTPEEYPFHDSDDNYDEDQKPQYVSSKKIKQMDKKTFDANKERKFLMERQSNDKNIALYLSTTGDVDKVAKTHNRLKESKSINPFRSLHVSQRGHDKKQKSANNKHYMRNLDRVDSITNSVDYDAFKESDVRNSMNQQEEEDIFRSFQPIKLNRDLEPSSPIFYRNIIQTESPSYPIFQKQQLKHDPKAYLRANSIINLYGLQQSQQFVNYDNNNFRVTITQKDDEVYLPPHQILKQILFDYGDDEYAPQFNLIIILNEQCKQLDNFTQYLKDIITYAYSYTGKPLLFMLQLIKQIKVQYPILVISQEFLQYYKALEVSNIKIKADFKIREIFPVQGLFLLSKDPMLLFDFVKENILEHIDYEQIVILKQILKGVFKKNEINDELYISFLAKLIQEYGRDTHSTQFQLKMQKERIEGLLSQIVMTILLLEKGQQLLRPVQSKQRRDQIVTLIKDVFLQKKKNYLIKQFEKKIANL